MKDLKEFIKLGISLANALGKSLEDGKLTYSDLPNLWPVLSNLTGALDGINEAVKELRILDARQLRELAVYVKDEFDIPQDQIEGVIESSLDLIASLLGTYALTKKNHAAEA